jgi:hypothetical protein
MSASPPGTAPVSVRAPNQDDVDEPHLSQLHVASTITADNLDDKNLDDFQQLEDEWEQDPANPRNWSLASKWTATTIVSSSIIIEYLITSPVSLHSTRL